MDRLEKLRTELSQMSQDEILAFIRKTRVDRKITKERPSARKARRVTADRTKAKASKAVAGLSAEALERLLKEFGDDEGNGDEDSGT